MSPNTSLSPLGIVTLIVLGRKGPHGFPLPGGRTGTFPYVECVFPKSFECESIAQMTLEVKGIVNGGLDVQEAVVRTR